MREFVIFRRRGDNMLKMYCSKCGEPVYGTANCPHCGARLIYGAGFSSTAAVTVPRDPITESEEAPAVFRLIAGVACITLSWLPFTGFLALIAGIWAFCSSLAAARRLSKAGKRSSFIIGCTIALGAVVFAALPTVATMTFGFLFASLFPQLANYLLTLLFL